MSDDALRADIAEKPRDPDRVAEVGAGHLRRRLLHSVDQLCRDDLCAIHGPAVVEVESGPANLVGSRCGQAAHRVAAAGHRPRTQDPDAPVGLASMADDEAARHDVVREEERLTQADRIEHQLLHRALV